MNLFEVYMRVEEIASSIGDPEHAHALEDRLHHDILNAIASGEESEPTKVRLLAEAAMKTRSLDFPRWYA